MSDVYTRPILRTDSGDIVVPIGDRTAPLPPLYTILWRLIVGGGQKNSSQQTATPLLTDVADLIHRETRWGHRRGLMLWYDDQHQRDGRGIGRLPEDVVRIIGRFLYSTGGGTRRGAAGRVQYY